MLSITYSVWRLGPVSVDVFEELSDGPVLLEDFDQKRANSSTVVIDMGRQLCPDDRAYYNETLENRQVANHWRWHLFHRRGLRS